jgi:hypothetical protein
MSLISDDQPMYSLKMSWTTRCAWFWSWLTLKVCQGSKKVDHHCRRSITIFLKDTSWGYNSGRMIFEVRDFISFTGIFKVTSYSKK